MTRGYLLDTNTIAFWFSPTRREHKLVVQRIEALPAESPLVTSAIVLGEIEYGCRAARPISQDALNEVARLVRARFPRMLQVGLSTAETYGRLRAALFRKYAPKKDRRGLRPEQLTDPMTSRELGIQENDLWIAAQALEHNLVLVTKDKLDHIRAVAPRLVLEDWTP